MAIIFGKNNTIASGGSAPLRTTGEVLNTPEGSSQTSLANQPVLNSESIYRGRIRIHRNEDYTISGASILFKFTVGQNELIVADYDRA